MSVQKQKNATYVFKYDITGGDSGSIAAHSLGTLPKNFVITQTWIHVLTTCTSATDAATMSVGYTGAATAFEAATAISTGTTWDAAAPRVSDAGADGIVANFITAAAGDDIIVTVAVEVVTAGKFLVVVEGYIGA